MEGDTKRIRIEEEKGDTVSSRDKILASKSLCNSLLVPWISFGDVLTLCRVCRQLRSVVFGDNRNVAHFRECIATRTSTFHHPESNIAPVLVKAFALGSGTCFEYFISRIHRGLLPKICNGLETRAVKQCIRACVSNGHLHMIAHAVQHFSSMAYRPFELFQMALAESARVPPLDAVLFERVNNLSVWETHGIDGRFRAGFKEHPHVVVRAALKWGNMDVFDRLVPDRTKTIVSWLDTVTGHGREFAVYDTLYANFEEYIAASSQNTQPRDQRRLKHLDFAVEAATRGNYAMMRHICDCYFKESPDTPMSDISWRTMCDRVTWLRRHMRAMSADTKVKKRKERVDRCVAWLLSNIAPTPSSSSVSVEFANDK